MLAQEEIKYPISVCFWIEEWTLRSPPKVKEKDGVCDLLMCLNWKHKQAILIEWQTAGRYELETLVFISISMQIYKWILFLSCIEQREVTYASLLFEDETTPT